MKRWMVCAMLGCAASLGQAEQATVWADVVDVRPVSRISETPADPARCNVAPPAHARGLMARLSWDLSEDCAPARSEVITGYDVTYTWAGNRYTYRRAEHPGERVAVQLTFDVQPSLRVR